MRMRRRGLDSVIRPDKIKRDTNDVKSLIQGAMAIWAWGILLSSFPVEAMAGEGLVSKPLDLTHAWAGYFSLVVLER